MNAKDRAYAERDIMVAVLSHIFPAHLTRHVGETWDDDWRNIVCVHGPTGQMTWHIHDSELPLFAHLGSDPTCAWDGHTTAEKYARLARACGVPGEQFTQMLGEGDEAHDFLSFVMRCQTVTPEERRQLDAARDAARATALHTGDGRRDAALRAAWGAAQERRSAWHAMRDAAWDAAGDAARDAASALVVRDLITPEQFHSLAGPWESVMGELS